YLSKERGVKSVSAVNRDIGKQEAQHRTGEQRSEGEECMECRVVQLTPGSPPACAAGGGSYNSNESVGENQPDQGPGERRCSVGADIAHDGDEDQRGDERRNDAADDPPKCGLRPGNRAGRS